MPKLPLVNGPYPSRSLASAASELTNLYVELVENPADQAKNSANLFGIPGRHLQAVLSLYPGNVRGLWSGGGRCFVAVGTWICEIGSTGLVIGAPYDTFTLGAVDDGTPVQFFGNGNQLAAVTGGFFLINNGAGWWPSLFEIHGKVSASGDTMTWQSGDPFTAAMLFQEITINGHQFVVTALPSPTTLTVDPITGLGGGTGTVDTIDTGVFWQSGPTFITGMEGLPITIDGLQYVVEKVVTPQFLKLTQGVPGGTYGVGLGLTYSTMLSGLEYTCAAGEAVTAVTGAYMDGTFYAHRPPVVGNGAQINFSGVLDGTSWRGIDFVSKEGAADHLRSILADGEVLYAFGVESSEAFQNNPSSGLPQRIPGAFIKFGSISSWGASAIGGKVYFVGGDAQGGPIAYRIDNTIPTRISTHAEEAQWLKAGFGPAKPGIGPGCVSYSYMEEGHVFWCINFGAETWAWDETNKFWHRRMQWDGTNFIPYDTQFHTYIPEWGTGRHITGGAGQNGNLVFESSVNFYDDMGYDMAWRRAIPYRYNAGNRIFFGRMTLEMETGTVAVDAPPPVVTRDYSDDRGNTFVNPRDASTGEHNDTSIRLFWLRNGQSRGRVWRFFGKGQSKVALIDLECDEILGTT